MNSHWSQYYTCFLSISLNNTTPPMTQAGHHTAHTTKEVYTPCATHPFAISTKVHSRSNRQYQLSAYSMTGGDTVACSSAAITPTATSIACLRFSFVICRDELEDSFGSGRTKLSGDARMPTTKARLKLSVASVDSIAPSNRREKDCMSWNCCEEALKPRTRMVLR